VAPLLCFLSSFSEVKVHKLLTKQPTDFVKYNGRQLSRIYPKGNRFDSSNYDPIPAWNCGAQIVALNYQTGSIPMWLNDGKFNDNGHCGFILKPKYMRDKETTFDPENSTMAPKSLEIKVVSGWQFPKAAGKETQQRGHVISPFVSVEVFGAGFDEAHSKTKIVKRNGFNPIFDHSATFPILNTDLAIVLFRVRNAHGIRKDDFIGQYAIPVHCIQRGYRVVPIKDKRGYPYSRSSLLVHFKWIDGKKAVNIQYKIAPSTSPTSPKVERKSDKK